MNVTNDAEREHWKRKPAPALDASKDNLCFQQLDIDYVIGEPHAMLGPGRKQQGDAARLRIFGVTAGDASELGSPPPLALEPPLPLMIGA